MSAPDITNGKVPDKSVPWYKADIGTIPPAGASLLQDYSKISPADLDDHIFRVREKAWKVAPYPCIGSCTFLELSITLDPAYEEVLSRIKKGQKFLDLGCCLGQGVRKLVHDGAPAENVFGTDINRELIDVGYDLFMDQETLRSSFFVADIFRAEDSAKMTALKGHLDIIFAGSFFHLFKWDQQVKLGIAMEKLLQPQAGSMVFGHHLGHLKSGAYPFGLGSSRTVFRHDAASFQELWRQIGEATGSQWGTRVALEPLKRSSFSKEGKWGDPDGRLMRFCVRRLADND